MSQFKRFNTSENNNYDPYSVYPEGTLTWDPSNGLRIHDGSTSGGNTVGGSSGTSLPSDSVGFLRNDGSGTLSWNTSTVTAGVSAYSDVWVLSSKAIDFWTQYTLTGQVNQLFDFQGTNNLTLSNQVVYGRQLSSGEKIFAVNDSSIESNDFGIVFEFPANPNPGDTFSASLVGDSIVVNAGSFVVGKTYTIVSTGDTNWAAVGAQYGGVGQTFTATGTGSGTGTASTPEGVQKRIYKPAAGQRARTMASGGQSQATYFGPNETVKAVYVQTGTQMDGQPIVWVYAGVLDGTPTWYQMFF